jgi:cell surface protein SprA
MTKQSNHQGRSGRLAIATIVFLLAWVMISLGLSRGRIRDDMPQPGLSHSTHPVLSSAGSVLTYVIPALSDTIPTRSKRLDRLHRRAVEAQRDTSGRMARDSLGRLIDTTLVIPTDSTARVKHFTYQRKDEPQVSIFTRRIHPLFLRSNPQVYRREVALDSTGTMVIIRETVDGKDVKIPLVVPLRDYIRLSFAAAERRGFEELAYQYKMKEKTDELTELLGSVTNIDIPIPPNPLLSLFGGRGINLRISGAVDIRAAFRNQATQQATISRLGNVRNEPDFNQEVQINVSGTVGDKLNINADWNTQRTFEYENQLRIKYTGYEDEIVQSVEAGNVSLPTPSSFVGSSQALFGFKAAFQMGPLRLTTIASQKKGQVREITLTGGAQDQTFDLRAYQYSTSHYFLDTLYRRTFSPYYDNFVPVVDPSLQVVDIEVWVTRLGLEDPDERDVAAFIDLPPRPAGGYSAERRNVQETIPGQIEVGRFVKLKRDQYILHPQTGYITLATNVQNEQAIAVAYRAENGPGSTDDIFYGEFTNVARDTSQRLVLKLVKPRNLIPQFKTAWSMLLKNIYSVGGRDLKKESFTLNLYYLPPGREPQDNILQVNLLQLLRLDKTDESGTGPPDTKFDFTPGLTVDATRGEIIFPSLEPFREGIIRGFRDHGISVPADSFVYAEVYDTTVTGARNNNAKDRFVLRGKFSSGTSSTYSLGFNVVDGSVEVFLEGQRLVANVDYLVDYSTGQLILRSEKALLPGANLQIKYEQNDLFQLASKTLLGARGDLRVTPRTTLGFTFMNLDQQTLSDKVRLNEEPINNTILGIDGSTSFESEFLTDALNILPFVRTRTPSSITLRGEAAYMLPDPNTKKSPIDIDQQKGVAYIDDFEGIKRTIPLGTSYGAWRHSSVPRFIPGLDPNVNVPLPDSTKVFSKARIQWYNIIPGDVFIRDIWPNRTVAQGSETQTVLSLAYDPMKRGVYNYSLDLQSTLYAEPRKNWAGIMRPVSTTASNLVDENITFIEIWAQVNGDPRGGKMIIDLGQISEDVIPNNKLDTEDGINPAFPVKNGVLNDGEDVGIDGLTDDQERQVYAEFIRRYPEFTGDPSGDNWSFVTGSLDFTRINGTEGNGSSVDGNLPDTEDLNRNGVADLVNSYFEYEVPLDTVGGAAQNPLIVGGGSNGWYQFRIPIIDYTRRIGEPSFSVVEFIRVWFTGFDQPVTVRIADFNLVGNQWQEAKRNDSTFSVTTVNFEDNPNYTIPPGVLRERDRTRPDQLIYANEQSMALIFNNILDGESRQAIRYFSFRPLDVFNYQTMKMFVHGDPHLRFVDTANYDVEMFFRFGLDTLNYYEYRAPVHHGDPTDPVTRGWDPLNNVEIVFSEITAVKQGRDSLGGVSIRYPVRNGPPGATYSVRGNPTLTQIRFISVGIENPLNKGTPFPISGQIWVNELRLSEVDDRSGVAYRFEAGVKLADLATIGLNFSKIDPAFHALDQRFGTRTTGINWGVSANFSLDKLLPDSWGGSSIPFSYSHVEGIIKPKYLPGTDVLVAEAARVQAEAAAARGAPPEAVRMASDSILAASQTLRVSESWAIPSARIVFPSDKWYIDDTFNKLSIGFNYTSASERSPITEFRQSWAWAGRLAYSLSFSSDNYITPFTGILSWIPFLKEYKDTKIFFTPGTLSWSVNVQRSRTRERARTQEGDKPIVRSFLADRSLSFAWKLTEGGLLNLGMDYGLDASSSLLHLETDEAGVQRPFSKILGDIFFGKKLVNFGLDYSYGQKVSLTPRLKLPNIFNINNFLEITTSYRADYRWLNNLQQRELGKSSSVASLLSLGMNFRLKQFTDPWFATAEPSKPGGSSGAAAGTKAREKTEPAPEEKDQAKEQKQQPPEGAEKGEEKVEETAGPSWGNRVKEFLRILIKVPLLDYDNITVNYSYQTTIQNTGLRGRTGFDNFWGRVPFFQKSLPENGPSRLYQLGLVTDPSGEVKNFGFRRQFPFFGADIERGLRAPGGNLVDNFGQSNKLDFKTSRQIVAGVRIDLSWKVGWSYNRNQTLTSDSVTGVVTVRSSLTTGDIERSYFSFPILFKNDISEVARRFNTLREDVGDHRADEEKLAEAFEDGFESLPILRKVLGSFVPRANWAIRWDGLERLPVLRDVASRVMLENAYVSTFNRRWRGNLGGGEITESERMTYGFSPLAGMNITFQDFLKGSLSSTVRFATTKTYDLNTASRNIIETSRKEVTVQGSFGRKGFAIPFFGVTLTNDIDITFSYTLSRDTRQTYDISNIEAGGIPLEGLSRTVIEPRIKYVLSTRVTASLFYRYTNVEPDRGASRIPGTKTNEAGLDIHISIQ